MVDLTRRKTVIGLGLLATGSGATFTSAAFESSTTSNADLSVLVEQNILFRANPELDPDNDADVTDAEEFFDDDDPSGGIDESGDDSAFSGGNEGENGIDKTNSPEGFEEQTPLAFVEGANNDLDVKTAVNIRDQDGAHRFDELFRIDNTTREDLKIGIAYDRASSQYGEDVGSSGLTFNQAQNIYQFQVSNPEEVSFENPGNVASDGQISPLSGEEGVEGDNSEIGHATDRPASAVVVPSGENVLVDLVVDVSTHRDAIRAEAELDPKQFGFQSDTVQIMDEITVGTLAGDISRPG